MSLLRIVVRTACIRAASLAVCALFGGGVWAQSTFATLTGSVLDASGSLVPGLTVTATNVGTNISSTGRSNSEGIYSIPNLMEGQYTLRAQATGFKETVVTQVQLAAHDIRRLDLRLALGAVKETVEVMAPPDLIETETPRISAVMNATTMNTLPVNSRSWMYNMDTNAMSTLPANAWWPSFAGSRYDQWQMTVDGSSTMDGFGNSAASNITETESVTDAKLHMVNNSAEYGQPAQVTMGTKSGTNECHGPAFEYYQSPWFRAPDPFQAERTAGVNHRLGFSAGGPREEERRWRLRNLSFQRWHSPNRP